MSALDPMLRPLHVAFCRHRATVEIHEDYFFAEVGAPFEETLLHQFQQCQNLGIAQRLVRKFNTIGLSLHRMREWHQSHARMDRHGRIMKGMIKNGGRLW